jgi:hypothetical protein
MKQIFSILIYLGLIGVGIMVLGGVHGTESNKKTIEGELQQIAAHASLYYSSKPEMGGGDGRFITGEKSNSYRLPERLQITDNAKYTLINIDEQEIVVLARSHLPLVGEKTVKIDGKGSVVETSFSAGSL